MQTNFNNKLDKQTIQKEWQKLFDKPVPTGCHPSFLEKSLAWQRQILAQGGLSASEGRRLLGESNADNTNAGTRLVRVWQGETHQVTVLADGYLYKDQHWKSLSAIARAITGTPWSGPVFFGVKK